MRKTRRRFLAAVGASLAIAGCQDDGAGPTPGSPGPAGTPGEGETASPAGDGVGGGTETDGMGEGTETDGMGDGTGTDGAGNGTAEAEDATVQVAEHDEYGEILVDNEGNTLYMFDQDEQGAGESACTDDCATNWPPLTAGEQEPTAGDGVQAELSTFERADGDTQVAANGWPLYYFANDESAGDANGQGVNDVWFVLDPNGEPIMDAGGGTATGTATETEAA